MAITNKVSELKSKADEVVDILKNIPYNKSDDYIEQHIVDLQSAKGFLKKLTKVVLYLIKEKS